jgi:transposase InsO family protein
MTRAGWSISMSPRILRRNGPPSNYARPFRLISPALSAPRSPWQRAYVERVIGSIRRECLDHVIVLGEASLGRILSCYVSYYHQTRPHLALEKDSPEPRPIQHQELGPVVAIRKGGGLHHRYERRAA